MKSQLFKALNGKKYSSKRYLPQIFFTRFVCSKALALDTANFYVDFFWRVKGKWKFVSLPRECSNNLKKLKKNLESLSIIQIFSRQIFDILIQCFRPKAIFDFFSDYPNLFKTRIFEIVFGLKFLLIRVILFLLKGINHGIRMILLCPLL